jgi:hypothetical protein
VPPADPRGLPRPPAGERPSEHGWSILEKSLGANNINVAITLNELAQLYNLQGRLADAAGKDQAVAAILRSVRTKIGPYPIAQEVIEERDRATLFRDALDDFARFKKIELPTVPAPNYQESR